MFTIQLKKPRNDSLCCPLEKTNTERSILRFYLDLYCLDGAPYHSAICYPVIVCPVCAIVNLTQTSSQPTSIMKTSRRFGCSRGNIIKAISYACNTKRHGTEQHVLTHTNYSFVHLSSRGFAEEKKKKKKKKRNGKCWRLDQRTVKKNDKRLSLPIHRLTRWNPMKKKKLNFEALILLTTTVRNEVIIFQKQQDQTMFLFLDFLLSLSTSYYFFSTSIHLIILNMQTTNEKRKRTDRFVTCS